MLPMSSHPRPLPVIVTQNKALSFRSFITGTPYIVKPNKVKAFHFISLFKSAKSRACLYSTLGVFMTFCYLDYKLSM